MTARYIIGDTRDVTATLPDGSVDLVMTSPPFLALRSYLPADHPLKDLEIGSEPDPATFLDVLLSLTAEWGRVLAPHGSICVELGDTYSGSSVEGSDQKGSTRSPNGSGMAGLKDSMVTKAGDGWPLAKSMCGIPHLYHLSLAYGRNLLTGEESPAGQWRVRNVVAWCRPNPPVGALGDKFRPATSYLTIATRARDRYFDLDAVRHANPRSNEPAMCSPKDFAQHEVGNRGKPTMAPQNPAGAPPLDYWVIPPAPYAGSHYAVYPPALLEKPIESMVPRRVCTVCGEPSRRIVRAESTGQNLRKPGHPDDANKQVGAVSSTHVPDVAHRTTVGWTDCGHGSYRCTSCHVVVPLDHAVQRSGEGSGSQAQVSSEALLVEPSEGASGSAEHAGDVRPVRNRVHGATGGALLHPELFSETGARGGAGEHDPAADSNAWAEDQPGRVRARVGPGGDAWATKERLHDGAPPGDAGASRPSARAVGDRPSSQRCEGRQPDRESGSGHEGAPCGNRDVPELPASLPGELGGYVCSCGSRDVEYIADHWRNGVVLDPFAGTGTTLMVATGHGRDAIGIDLDARNAALALDRVGPLLLTVEHHTPEAGAA